MSLVFETIKEILDSGNCRYIVRLSSLLQLGYPSLQGAKAVIDIISDPFEQLSCGECSVRLDAFLFALP